ELPRKQPIRDNLDAIAERSARIDRMRAILTAIRPEVEAEVEALFGRTLFLDRPTPARLSAWRTRAQSSAIARVGIGYAAYGHLKVASVVEHLVRLAHQLSGNPRGRRLRTKIEAGVAALGAHEVGAGYPGRASPAAVDFLRRLDLGFRIRRLRLLARRIAEMESAGQPVPAAREAVYASLAVYLDLEGTQAHADLRPGLRGDGRVLIDAIASSYDLVRLDADTDIRLAAALATLDKDARRPLLLTYLGFVHYDLATLPLLQGEGLDEFDPVKVDRIAPDDATSIRAGGAEATLKGIQFNSFGAFFSRAYRENDYLWGRLHGAERMIDIAVSTLPARLRAGRVAAIKRAAFLAILDEEEPRLTAIATLFATLRREIG
ncbi:MAG TPA: DUF3376 domain-containing protein, partial [Sphingomonas sp.]|nr:DUF3376 domain-containing protein [Sphingomonas sp.]